MGSLPLFPISVPHSPAPPLCLARAKTGRTQPSAPSSISYSAKNWKRREGKVSLFLWRKRNGPFNNKYSKVQPLLTIIRLEAMKLRARHFIEALNCQWFRNPRLFACFDPYICLTVPFNGVGQPYLHAKC